MLEYGLQELATLFHQNIHNQPLSHHFLYLGPGEGKENQSKFMCT